MAITEGNILLWLDMADGTGSSVTDESAAGKDASITNATWGSGSPSGLSGNHVSFDGSGDLLTFASQPAFPATNGVGTLWLWIRTGSVANGQRVIITKSTTAAATDYSIIDFEGNGDHLRYITVISGNNWGCDLASALTSTTEDYLIAFTADNSANVKMWLGTASGGTIAQQTVSGFSMGETPNFFELGNEWRIGCFFNNGGNSNYWNGRIYQVGMSSDVFGQTEFDQLIASGAGITYDALFAAAGTNMQVNIGDAWKSVAGMQINIGDAWKTVAGAKVNIGDAWKTIF